MNKNTVIVTCKEKSEILNIGYIYICTKPEYVSMRGSKKICWGGGCPGDRVAKGDAYFR